MWHYRDADGDAIEHLIVFRFGDVFVEYRAQYRPLNRITALGSFDKFLHEIGRPNPKQ